MKIDRQEIYRLAGFIGVAMILAGLIQYLVLGILVGEGFRGKLAPALLIIGAVLVLVSAVFNFRAILGFFGGRQGKLGTNTVVLSVAVLALVVIANYAGYKSHKRFDLTAEGLYSISEQTKKVVANLPKDVKVIYFNKEDNQQFSDLMSEYKYAGPRLTYERVNPNQRPEMARQYKVQRMGDIVVSAGDRSEIISDTAEQGVTNAILKVTRDSLKTICFLEGHGEKALSDKQAEGFSTVEQRLKDENYQIKTVLLVREQQVPSECAALVVAGPKQAVTPPEVAMIGRYLDGGGKAMLMLDPETDPQFDELLKGWNIQSADNIVLDVSGVGQMIGAGALAPVVLEYGSHTITKDFGRYMSVFPKARAIKVTSGTGGANTANTTPLLTTSEQSYTKDKITPGVSPDFVAGKDQKGPLTLGVAANKGVGEKKEARLVVIGNSEFAANGIFKNPSFRNADLFLNSVNWLAEDEDLISIRPKSITNRSVTMTASQQRTFFLLSVAFMPLAVIGSGIYIWLKRR
ncbi:MAG TPA: Gldg family protein [Blastocatellia bacterium]|nr:Gldg family protein [Blastocatellia bacterium]